MKTTTVNVDNYITSIYTIKKKEEEIAVSTFKAKTGIKIEKKFGNYYLLIEDIFTDEPTNQISLYYRYIGYGSISFLGNINGKVKEHLRYINNDIQEATESLILKLHYTNKEVQEAIQEVYKTHGKPKTDIGIIKRQVYNKV